MYFYDTNALLELQERAFGGSFFICSKTMEEIEHIKTSASKDAEIKYKARHVSKLLDEHWGEYTVSCPKFTEIMAVLAEYGLEDTNDAKIMACAWIESQKQNIVFVSDDINCKCLARMIFGLETKSVDEIHGTHADEYTGYKDVTLSDEEMSDFYCNQDNNKFGCLLNEYLIIRKSDGDIVDTIKWDGERFKKVCPKTIKSTMFGDKIHPKDVYQSLAIDSILSNTLTAISGKAGSGKSLISLVTIMNLIETGEYDRVIIMFNPTKARGASDMGFYTGDAVEKAMQNSIGSMLTTKFGDRFAVDLLLQQDKIRLVSMADIRGMEVRDREICYIPECQNTSVDLLKLCLSRASSGCKIIVEGDYESQVDSYLFYGGSNGLKRAIHALKGESEFGYVNLPNVWRSKIATLVDKL